MRVVPELIVFEPPLKLLNPLYIFRIQFQTILRVFQLLPILVFQLQYITSP